MLRLSAHECELIEREQDSQVKDAHFKALLIVTNAFDADKILKRNLHMI